MNHERILCIDPATKHMGWAIFEDGNLVDSGHRKANGKDWLQNMDQQLDFLYEFDDLDKVVIELPEAWGSSDRSVAAMNSVLKLSVLVGAIRYMFAIEAGIAVELVTVRQWKGQVPKEVTIRRIRKHWGWTGRDHNEADAVGIGDWYLRKRKAVRGT